MTRQCEVCGAAFEATRSTAQTCSEKCRAKRSRSGKAPVSTGAVVVREVAGLRARLDELSGCLAHVDRLEARVQALENAGAVYGGALAERPYTARVREEPEEFAEDLPHYTEDEPADEGPDELTYSDPEEVA